MTPPFISVVIPVFDDVTELEALLRDLGRPPGVERIVACAGPGEQYAAIRREQPDVTWVAAPRGRAVQMNAGAARASGAWLLFLHADARLDAGWREEIARLDAEPVVGGAFRFALRSPAWQARVVEWGVGQRVRWMRLPYGDQAIFVRRGIFDRMDGYRDLPLMEDVDFVLRLRREGRLRHLETPVRVSARRWEREGWMRRTLENTVLVILYALGADPARLARRYYRGMSAGSDRLHEARPQARS